MNIDAVHHFNFDHSLSSHPYVEDIILYYYF